MRCSFVIGSPRAMASKMCLYKTLPSGGRENQKLFRVFVSIRSYVFFVCRPGLAHPQRMNIRNPPYKPPPFRRTRLPANTKMFQSCLFHLQLLMEVGESFVWRMFILFRGARRFDSQYCPLYVCLLPKSIVGFQKSPYVFQLPIPNVVVVGFPNSPIYDFPR